MKVKILIITGVLLAGCVSQQNLSDETENIFTKPETINTYLEFELKTGKYHNHPSFAGIRGTA